MSADNKTLIRRFGEEIWNKGNLLVADEFLAPNVVGHFTHLPSPTNRDGFTDFVTQLRLAFPDLAFTLDDLRRAWSLPRPSPTNRQPIEADGPHNGATFCNIPRCIEQNVEWVTDCLRHMRANNYTQIVATPEAEDDRTAHVNEVAEGTILLDTPS